MIKIDSTAIQWQFNGYSAATLQYINNDKFSYD